MLGIIGAAVMAVVVCFALWAVYAIIRLAVRDGMRDALRMNEAERVRSELGLGKERGLNQSS